MWEILVAFIAGLMTGAVTQTIRFRYNIKQERVSRLMPYFERCDAMVQPLKDDVNHGIRLLEANRRDELVAHLDSIEVGIERFHVWFSEFLAVGMRAHLEGMNKVVFQCMHGINAYHHQLQNESNESLIPALERLAELLKKSSEYVERFVKSYGRA